MTHAGAGGPVRAEPPAPAAAGVLAMLEARTVAVVGATDRAGSFGARLLAELERSPAAPAIHLVNPRRPSVGRRPCVPTLKELDEPVDLALLAVPGAALAPALEDAATAGARSAVIYGNAAGAGPDGRTPLREHLAGVARGAGMALCGAGCMGFVNVAHGLRAIGYVEPHPLPPGGVCVVTHSGSVFSALLRAGRGFGWSLAVSSGQELVTTAADYLDYALDRTGTAVVGLLLEALRDGPRLRGVLRRAAERDVPVVALTLGRSAAGRRLVRAHCGALAGDDGAWEALFDASGVRRARDLGELADTLELLAAGRRPRRGAGGIATVHDSGAERAHAADVADSVGVPFAPIGTRTKARLAAILEPGLQPENPLDLWGTGDRTRRRFAEALAALADDPQVAAVALAVDLCPELDGDDSYPLAVLDAHAGTDTPLAVLSNLPSAVDRAAAARLRSAGVPVLEGTRSGLAALGHLLAIARRPLAGDATRPPTPDAARRARWRSRLCAGPLSQLDGFDLLADYGIPSPPARAASSVEEAVEAARSVGFPVALKSARHGLDHKGEAGGVVLDRRGPDDLADAYRDLAARLGPDVLVAAMAPAATAELALGLLRDPQLGPLVVLAAGGALVEHLRDRAVGLPPLDAAAAERLLERLAAGALLAGGRGRAPADAGAVVDAVLAISRLAEELGDVVDELDVNPLACGPAGACALDVLVVAGGRS